MCITTIRQSLKGCDRLEVHRHSRTSSWKVHTVCGYLTTSNLMWSCSIQICNNLQVYQLKVTYFIMISDLPEGSLKFFLFDFFLCYWFKINLRSGMTLTLLYLSVSLSFQWQIPLTLAMGNTSHISSETVIWVSKKTGKFSSDTTQSELYRIITYLMYYHALTDTSRH